MRQNEKKGDFASMLEESFRKQKKIESGAVYTAKIISIKNDYIFIRTIQDNFSGILAKDEFENIEKLSPGDTLKVYFLSENSGDYYFTTCLTGENLTYGNIETAFHAEIPVEGQVGQEQKAGYEIKLGEFIAFCPFSQIDTDLKGKTLTGSKIRFMISDITREKNSRIILSQKKISDKEKELKKEILKTELQVGQFVTCKIKSLHKFGIIVDMGGVDALVPASEASHKKNSELEKEFSIGQTLRAKVLSIDWKENRISLSIKDFLVDPWSNSVNFKEGDIITGTVESIKQFGIFVKLNENFSGLVPNKETGLSQKTPVSNHFKPGDSVEVFVTEVNPSKRQIALSVQKAKDARERMDYSKYLQDTDTKSVSSFGLLLKKSLSKK